MLTYDIIVEFITSAINYTHDQLRKEQNHSNFLKICATIPQDYEKRVSKINSLFRLANNIWDNFFPKQSVTGKRFVSALFNNQWEAIVMPLLRERIERIAWQIHTGQHDQWKPGGNEWRNIEKFYGGLGQRVTVTRLTVTVQLVPVRWVRKIYLTTRPVDASEKNPQQSLMIRPGQANDRRTNNSRVHTGPHRQGVTGAPSCIPVSCQHWALVVSDDQRSPLWELYVVNGRNKVKKQPNYYVDASNSILVGFTSLTDDEISASGMFRPDPIIHFGMFVDNANTV
jgi:hypothetical protein